mgnify:CR=1 FL=1
MSNDRLTILNCGLGRDSITMCCLLIEDNLIAGGEKIQPENLNTVVFSDTGAEWPHTYALIPRIKKLVEDAGVPFVILQKPPIAAWKADNRPKGDRTAPEWTKKTGNPFDLAKLGVYHRRGPILQDYMKKGTICTISSSACTFNFKILPIRRFLSDLCVTNFGEDNRSWSLGVRKGARRPHRILIGIAADEQSRAVHSAGPKYETALYPLLEMGITKSDEAAILARHGLDHIRKSGCSHCPYQPISWFWVLRELHPSLWAHILEYERRALARNPKMFVTGNKPLDQVIEAWARANPNADVDAILDKTYQRGCTTPTDGGSAARVQGGTERPMVEGQLNLFQKEAA